MAAPTLFRVIVPVTDVEQATAFYATVLELPGERVSPGRHYFDCGGTILACFDPRADGDDFELSSAPGHLYISVDDLGATRERLLTASDALVGEIAKRPWGEMSLYTKDPFGNKLCFVERGSEFRGTAG